MTNVDKDTIVENGRKSTLDQTIKIYNDLIKYFSTAQLEEQSKRIGDELKKRRRKAVEPSSSTGGIRPYNYDEGYDI